jgi:hypothetical protein
MGNYHQPMDSPVDPRKFDVYPFPLSIAVHWTAEGFQMDLVVVTAMDQAGYSSETVASHVVPYAGAHAPQEAAPNAAEFDEALRAAISVFAGKIARALRD